MSLDDTLYMEKLSVMLRDWIGTKHPMQTFYGAPLHKLLRHNLRKFIVDQPFVSY